MEKIRMGIMSPSNIAFHRFLPSLQKAEGFQYMGVAVADQREWFGEASETLLQAEQKKARGFQEKYGGEIFSGYRSLLENPKIDAVYLPLPPALHYEWAMRALQSGKHVLVEKPSTTCLADTSALAEEAERRNLAVHENYMFQYHSQIKTIREMIVSGELGEIRAYKLSFGFPRRDAADFRYNKSMGGGALLDCGGYPVKLASLLLGDSAKLVQSRLNHVPGCEVDLFGTAVMENADGICAQISFGMDNAYQCQLEVWGSKITLIAPRVFTAGTDVPPSLILRSSRDEKTIALEKDDQFLHSIEWFGKAVAEETVRKNNREAMRTQAAFVEAIREREESACR